MRKIQFNAWDINRKKMIPNVAVYHDGSIGFTSDTARQVYGHDHALWPGGERFAWIFMAPTEIIILQSSETPDKHGRMMYDGHIVECLNEDPLESDGHSATYHHITFKDGSFGWLGEITGEFYPFSEDPLSDCEIVGNIFENPELLKMNGTNK